MKNIAVILILLVVIYSCREKDKSNNALYKIDLENIYSIALSKKLSGIKNDDSLALYKITSNDNLSEITFYNSDNNPLTGVYTPVAIYHLNKEYFLMVLKTIGSAEKITNCYLISKANGMAKELKSLVYPLKYMDTGWETDYDMNVIKNPHENIFIIPGENNITKLSVKNEEEIEITSYTANNLKYETDTAGNILTDNNLIYVNGNSVELSVITESTILAQRYENGFYLIDRNTEKITISQLTIGEDNYELNLKKEITFDASSWAYLGNASLPYFAAVLPIFDKGILLIENDQQKLIPASTFGLTTIQSFYQSDDYLYVIGVNSIEKEIFIKINIGENPPSYSSLFSPGFYEFYLTQVNNNNSLSFYANRTNDSEEVICYLTSSLYINTIENDQNLKPKQFVTIK